jgi:hypothetical protein
LPKELAEFRVGAVGVDAERVQVSQAGLPIASFLRTPPRGVLPIDLGRIPAGARRLVQVFEGRVFDTVPGARARCGLTRISGLEVNRELLPDARCSRWRLGMHLDRVELFFPAANIVALRADVTAPSPGALPETPTAERPGESLPMFSGLPRAEPRE